MGKLFAAATQLAVVNLNQPGRYLHWSIFTVSVANLVVIAVMVVIFGIALVVRFPGHKGGHDAYAASPAPPTELDGSGGNMGDGGTRASQVAAPMALYGDKTWAGSLRRFGLRLLPPGKLLPDRQPAYVASWIYVFGVATLAALGLAVLSGTTIALGGPDWWHTNPVGHFFNSMHLWSVELFMAFMVIHLWGKFWMAAWRGRRALTWMTGVLAFMASIVECFTGYLSQQNFDSQWISTNGKDAINATGLGGFFNLMNFGQMLLWHIVLVPITLIAIVGAHILLVRVRGVAHPLPITRPRSREARRHMREADAGEWRGPTRVYDIVKEAVAATVISGVLVVLLAAVLSSPDEPAITIASWAKLAPADFMATATGELAGTTETANYGPPYNNSAGSTQRLGISWEALAGARVQVNAAHDFVLAPLSKIAPSNAPLAVALRTYEAAPPAKQVAWTKAYSSVLEHVTFHGGKPDLPTAADGPVPELVSTELALARSGALDADLIAGQSFYGTNFTRPLLFIEDGEYFAEKAQTQHLLGSQWGVMNETGSYPGQPWLWLYTLWYQLPGFDNSANVDLIAIYMTGLATILLLALPFIPGLRNIPEVVPLHRVIWKSWHSRGSSSAGAQTATLTVGTSPGQQTPVRPD